MLGSSTMSATEPSSEPTTTPPSTMPTVQPMMVPRASLVTRVKGPASSAAGPARAVARRDDAGTEVAAVEHGDRDGDADHEGRARRAGGSTCGSRRRPRPDPAQPSGDSQPRAWTNGALVGGVGDGAQREHRAEVAEAETGGATSGGGELHDDGATRRPWRGRPSSRRPRRRRCRWRPCRGRRARAPDSTLAATTATVARVTAAASADQRPTTPAPSSSRRPSSSSVRVCRRTTTNAEHGGEEGAHHHGLAARRGRRRCAPGPGRRGR